MFFREAPTLRRQTVIGASLWWLLSSFGLVTAYHKAKINITHL
jgi:hypothetical protein